MRILKLVLCLSLSLTFACKKSKSKADSENSGALQTGLSDEFPDFYKLAVESTPSFTSTTQLELPLTLANLPTTYTTDSNEFLTAFDVDQNFIGQVLNDAGDSGPVKSIYVLLAQVQSTLDSINSVTVNEETALEGGDEGSQKMTCTKITSDDVTTPFFSTATNEAFNKWEDKGKYTCLADDTDGLLAFGSMAIADPAEGCEAEDAYEFFVIEGSAKDNEKNTEQTNTRGTTKDFASIKKFYYNGCTGDLNIAYAQSTLYSAGVEFSSRTELSGNALEKTFSLRSNFIDADTGYATHNTFAGHGKSKKASEDDDDAYFIMGYRSDNCGTSADSSNCTLGAAKSFCVKNSGTGTDVALAADTANCSDYEADYKALNVLVRKDLPSGYFKVSAEDAGL